MDSAKKSHKEFAIGNLLAELEAEIARLEGLIQDAEDRPGNRDDLDVA